MKKYEELSKDEKKVVQTEFNVSGFGKWFKLYKLYEVISVLFFILVWFTDFFENASVFCCVLVLILFVGFGEYVSYKKKKLVKVYYELKNNK